MWSLLCVISRFFILRELATSTLFPYTTLFRSWHGDILFRWFDQLRPTAYLPRSPMMMKAITIPYSAIAFIIMGRSEEHTSELQSHSDLVCRLLLEKKKNPFSPRQINRV